MKVSEYREQMTERVAVIEAQVIDIYHDIKEIKQLLKEQNGRVRTNEKNIARITTAGMIIAILLGLL
jgi:acetyl-CoA carboxylase carboxyltransferase component